VEILFDEPSDEDCPARFDVLGHLDALTRRWRGRLSGVFSTSDYPGATVAAALATALGLPGPSPEAVIGCSHKWYSRLTQREAVPEAVPDFALVHPDRPLGGQPSIGFPCFVKPVKGAFSVLARRVETPEELGDHLARPQVREVLDGWLAMFHVLVRELTDFEVDGRHFIAEGLLAGDQVTAEGFEHAGTIELLGITDSVFHPLHRSFARFDYPSRLPADVQERMAGIVRRFVAASGLRDTLFNVELAHDPATGRVAIIEANPRACGQFADLYEKVDGTNGYEVALALATGRRPALRKRAGRFARAASYPLRVHAPCVVEHAPGDDEIARIEAEGDGTLVWNECATGQELTDFVLGEDGSSFRHAVVNVGGDSLEDLEARCRTVRERLGWRFAPAP
jgi:biotin carboxylase